VNQIVKNISCPPAWGLGEVLTTPSRENTHVMNYSQHEMLPMEIKQSGCKLLPHSVLRGGVFPEGVSRSFQKQEKGHSVRYMEC
jgi:hypothetical protein